MKNDRKKENQHYVPRMYLRFFAEDELIVIVDRETGKQRRGNPSNEARMKDLYSFRADDGQVIDLEDQLGQIEGDATAVLARITAHPSFELTADDRVKIADLLAVQAVRTPEQWQMLKASYGYFVDTTMSLPITDIPSALDALARSGFVPNRESAQLTLLGQLYRKEGDQLLNPNDWIEFIVRTSARVKDEFLSRRWVLSVFDSHSLITSDNAFLRLPGSDCKEGELLSIESAAAICFPLTPRIALAMHRVESKDPASLTLTSRMVGAPRLMEAMNRNSAVRSFISYFVPPSLAIGREFEPLSRRSAFHVESEEFSDEATQASKPPFRLHPDRFS
jgi:Protein of unknown function (DUF4238)